MTSQMDFFLCAVSCGSGKLELNTVLKTFRKVVLHLQTLNTTYLRPGSSRVHHTQGGTPPLHPPPAMSSMPSDPQTAHAAEEIKTIAK